ncbi:MAG TPA: hypothetical protein VKL61_05950 [Candidatus Polarisedimenticolia bacterium]|nr:hypothetical protein [Candidatus Polarisedimenticolia bacterium]
MVRVFVFSLLALVTLPSPGLAGSVPTTTPREDLTIILQSSTILGLLSSATPYEVHVGGSLLRETLTFTEPRNLLLQAGRISFSVRCRGTPVAVDQTLRPVLVLKEPGGGAGYRVVVESLPVAIPGLGTVDLKDLFEPIEIQSLLRQSVFLQGRPAWIDVQVRRITLRADRVDLGASIRLTSDRGR